MGEEHEEWYSWSRTAKPNKFEISGDSSITFDTGDNEMLKITHDAFYVRGVAVEQGPGEAEAVYKAFREFMTWAIISKPE